MTGPESMRLGSCYEYGKWVYVGSGRMPPFNRSSQQESSTAAEWIEQGLTRSRVGLYQSMNNRRMEFGGESKEVMSKAWCADIREVEASVSGRRSSHRISSCFTFH